MLGGSTYQLGTYEDTEGSEGSEQDPLQGSPSPGLVTNLTRRKRAYSILLESPLRRWLSYPDLTLLGMGTVIGIGIYVMTARLSSDTAGPAFVLSVLLASFAAFLSSICYAEFTSRVPKYGSAYVYCYMALGEIWAFVVGWTMILEYSLASAVLARTCSEYIDFLFGGMIYDLFINKVAHWDYSVLARFPDFLALFLVLFMVVIVSLGPRWAAIFNRSVAVINVIVLIMVFVMGLFLVKAENWTHAFTPYGVDGVVRAASSGFVAFIGLDVIAAASGEASSPQSSVSQSIFVSVTISIILYCGLAVVLTLISSYHELSELAPLAKVFAHIPGAQYLISVGAASALLSGLFSCSFAGPRVMFNMANDGLLFTSLGHVGDSSHVPVQTTLICGLLSGCIATFFDVKHLIELLSIGTLTAYTMVAISVLITRIQPGVESVAYGKEAKRERTNQWLASVTRGEPETEADVSSLHSSKSSQLPASDKKKRVLKKEPNKYSTFHASFAVFLLVISLTGLGLTLATSLKPLLAGEIEAFLLAGLSGLFLLASLMLLCRQPKNSATFPVMVPCFPGLPIVTIFLNILLIIELDYWNFARFGAWIILGMLIYAFYGYWRSTEAIKPTESPGSDFILYEKPALDQRINQIQPQTTNDD